MNDITIKENYPTPHIEDNLAKLHNKKYFSILDLKNGYFHVNVANDSIKYTSFVCQLGQFEYLKMPFGLCNAPRVFQRYIHKIFEKLIGSGDVVSYLDDLLVVSPTLEHHTKTLQLVFDIAARNSLKFRLDKCHFYKTEVNYLGYTITEKGITPNKDNIKAIVDYPIPKSTKEIQKFIGLASYFRKFIKNFSVIAKPLYDLLRTNARFVFGEAELNAFDDLRNCLISPEVLAIYSPHLETQLHCDASALGFGSVLLQKQSDNKWKPVSYFSQRTTPCEAKYHSFELECLAAIYSIKRFHMYLSYLLQ